MERSPKRRHLNHPAPSHTAEPERIADLFPLRGRSSCARAVSALAWFSVLLWIVATNAQGEGICGRTPQVQTKLVVLSRTDGCGQVTPRHLAEIKKVNLIGLRISSLQAHDFHGLVSLEELYLGGNFLTSLPEGVFQGLGRLKRLSVSDNSLTSLPQGIFEGLGSLEHLSLSRNSLSSLPSGIFQKLGSLKILWLNVNPLTHLPGGVFKGLSNLEKLVLSGTSLSVLPEAVFSELGNLKILTLGRNTLTALPEGLFSGLNALETLDLYENRLTSLPSGIFRGLGALKILALDSNRLSSLPERVFSGLTGLYNLQLNDNALSQLPEKVFHGLDKLGNLQLENNALTSLPAGIFDDVLDTLGGETFGFYRRTVEMGRGCGNCGRLLVDEILQATIAFAPTSQIATEGQTVRVTVTLSRPLPVAIRIHYSASDYGHPFRLPHNYEIVYPTPDEGILFLAGETSKDIEVSLLEDGNPRVETIEFSLPFATGDMPLLRSDGTGEKAPELETYFLAYRSNLDNQHVVTIVSGSLPREFAPKDSSHFTDWAVGKRLTWYDGEVFFRDGIRFRYEYAYGGAFTGRNYRTGSYSYRSEGPHVGTVALSYDGGHYDELQITFLSETTGVILHKSLQLEEDIV